MENKRIRYLLRKYDKSYVRGERFSTETNTLNKRMHRKAEKHLVCDELIEECSFDFSDDEQEFIHFLIDRFSDNFKKLHGKAKNEAIILTFMFYVKKLGDSRININNYSISKKYGLTNDVFLLIICRICDNFIKSSPIHFQETTRYNHEILSKNGGKL